MPTSSTLTSFCGTKHSMNNEQSIVLANPTCRPNGYLVSANRNSNTCPYVVLQCALKKQCMYLPSLLPPCFLSPFPTPSLLSEDQQLLKVKGSGSRKPSLKTKTKKDIAAIVQSSLMDGSDSVKKCTCKKPHPANQSSRPPRTPGPFQPENKKRTSNQTPS